MSEKPVLIEVFPWNHTFETNIASVDKQHKRLVMLLNQMGSKLAQGDDLVKIDKVIDELYSYADYHFKSEEKIWKERFHDDEWQVNHEKTHAEFIERVDNFRQK